MCRADLADLTALVAIPNAHAWREKRSFVAHGACNHIIVQGLQTPESSSIRGQAKGDHQMAYIDSTHVSAPSSRRFGGRIAGFLAKSWADYVAAREQQASIAALHSLDDRSLRDIGLHRSEIEWAVYCRNGHDLE